MKIIPSLPHHARIIGKGITMAIGDELAERLGAPEHSSADVETLFASLAARTDTQYSYMNSFSAVDDSGEVMGILVCYDGARLIGLRRVFFSEAARQIGLKTEGDVDDLPVETSPDEFYLDSLAVMPEYRGRGVATALIEAAGVRARECGKPLGLLVDKTNSRARRLYDSLGFKQVGERFFAGELMDHLQLLNPDAI